MWQWEKTKELAIKKDKPKTIKDTRSTTWGVKRAVGKESCVEVGTEKGGG